MIEDGDRAVEPKRTVAVNDNGAAETGLDAAILRIARLIGRHQFRVCRELDCRPQWKCGQAKAGPCGNGLFWYRSR